MQRSILKIKPAVQHYDWGGNRFIPELLGVENADGKPFAELWMGAHPRGPALVAANGKALPLNELIEKDPEIILGREVIARFGPHLPYLFKVLDVKKMLSIQTHPTKKAAEEGFRKENELGIPLHAFNRNFKDNNHKPEIMVALGDFWLLHGFQSADKIEAVLHTVPEFAGLKKHFKGKDIFHLYKTTITLPQEEADAILRPLGERLLKESAEGKLIKSHPGYWAAQAFREHGRPGGHCDRGIFSIYFFNLVALKKGEGIYQGAGIPHAYLEGVNVELMANSDNVFRGGLTSKHIDVDQLLKHLIVEPVVPEILTGEQISDSERIYACPAPDFLLSLISLSAETTRHQEQSKAPEILIVLEGQVAISSGSGHAGGKKGEAFLVIPGTRYEIHATGEKARVFKAAVPF